MVEEPKSGTPFSRRNLLAASVTTASTALAGCVDVFGDSGSKSVRVKKSKLRLKSDRSGVLTLSLAGGAEKIANSNQVLSNIRVAGEVVDVSAVNSGTLRIKIENLLRIRDLGDGSTHLSHSPIGFDVGAEYSISFDSDAECLIYYPMYAASSGSGGLRYAPSYRFKESKLSEYVEIEELLANGDDARFNEQRTDDYRPFGEAYPTDWKIKFPQSAKDTRWIHDYTSDAPVTWSNEDEQFSYDGSHSAPWTYHDDIDTTHQIPGTSHYLNESRILLELEGYSRDYLYRQLNRLISDSTTSRKEVVESMKDFVLNVSKTMATVARFSPGYLNSLRMGRTLYKLGDSADKLLEHSLDHFNQFNDWSGYVNGSSGDNLHTYDHLEVLSDIEVNEIVTLVEYQLGEEISNSLLNQYNDNLLQQFIIGKTLVTALDKISSNPLAGAELPEKDRALVQFILNTTRQTNESLLRSFHLLDSLSDTNTATEQTTSNTSEKEQKFVAIPTSKDRWRVGAGDWNFGKDHISQNSEDFNKTVFARKIELSDGEFSADITSGDGRYGQHIVWRSDGEQRSNYYFFGAILDRQHNPTNFVKWGYFENGNPINIEKMSIENAPITIAKGEKHTFRVQFVGDTHKMSIDGHLLFTGTNQAHKTGTVGFHCGGKTKFSNIRYKRL